MKACIGKKGAYLWDQENNRTYFILEDARREFICGPSPINSNTTHHTEFITIDRSDEWRRLYATNKNQVSKEYQEYALEFAKMAYRKKNSRARTRIPFAHWVGNMWPENEPDKWNKQQYTRKE